jgi:uncharacterized membrane protein
MQFSDNILARIAIFILGVCGFLIARHIRQHKISETPLVCPVGFDCHAVVHSDYSKFLGAPVEILGMVYYAFISTTYLSFVFLSNILPNALISPIVALSVTAFIFSVYLIGVQIFILKKGCSWCIVSTIITALIFVLTLV